MKIKGISKGSSILTISLLTISGAHFVSHVFGSVHTALFPIFRDEFHLTLQQLGLIAAIPPLCQALSYIPSGLIADRFGQKTLIILSFITAGVSAIGLSFSNNIISLVFFLSILITSITIYHPPAYSLTSELFPRETRGRALGIHGAGGTLGMALGPISLSLFIGYLLWNWRSVYFFWAIPILLYILPIWRLKTPETLQISEEKTAKKERPDASKKRFQSVFTIGVIGFMIFQATRNMGAQIIQTYIPTYIHDEIGLTVAEASFIFGVASLTGVFAAPIGGYLADRLGDKRWLIMAIGTNAVCLLLSAFTANIIIFSILYWCAGFFRSSGMGAASSIIARSTPSGRRGLGYALYFLPGSIVRTISPILGAFIASIFGLWILFPVSVAILIISIVILNVGVSAR